MNTYNFDYAKELSRGTFAFENVGEDSDLFVFAFTGDDGEIFITESPSLVGWQKNGTKQPVFKKDGVYYAPFYSSVTYPFARENGYELVVEVPDHHEILNAWDADGKEIAVVYGGRFQRELIRWYEPTGGDFDESDELVGVATILRLKGGRK